VIGLFRKAVAVYRFATKKSIEGFFFLKDSLSIKHKEIAINKGIIID